MILNYNSKNNTWSTFADNFKYQIKNVKKEIEKGLSKELNDIFSILDLDGDLVGQLLDNGYDSEAINNLADKSLANLVNSLDDTQRSSLTAGEALKQLSTTTVTVTEKTSKAASAMKTLGSIGKNLLSFGANMLGSMAVSWVITSIIGLIDDAVHKSERLIEAGEQARSKIAEINDAYNEKKTFNSENAERFDELRKKSTVSNVKIFNI